MAYSAQTFVADEQPTTAKWNILWSNDASFNDGSGFATGTASVGIPIAAVKQEAYTSFTPVWTTAGTPPTQTGATLSGRYARIGNTVFYDSKLIWGAGTAAGTGIWRFTMPTSVSSFVTSDTIIGQAHGVDNGNNDYHGYALWKPANTAADIEFYAGGGGGAMSSTSATSPFTWGSTDFLYIHGNYEAV